MRVDNKRKIIGMPTMNETHDDHAQVNDGVDERTTIKNNMSENGLLLQLHTSSTKDNKKSKKKELQNSTELIDERKLISSCTNEGS